jgi:rare lipoprotein A
MNYRKVPVVDSAIGYASYYSNRFIGKKTASGEVFSQKKMTCAHNTLPLGTLVRVTSLKSEKYVVVRVNDRLHKHNPRLVDLSKAAATQLGFVKKGIIKVSVVVLKDENDVKKVSEE